MTVRNKLWLTFLFTVLIVTAWMEGNIAGKEQRRAEMTEAELIIKQEADWLTQLQIADTRARER